MQRDKEYMIDILEAQKKHRLLILRFHGVI